MRLSLPFAALLVLASSHAGAQGRLQTPAVSCAQAVAVIAREGAAVLGTGGPTYDRFVRDRSFCEPTESVKRAFVPSRDTPRCFIGYTCYEPGRSDRFDDD